MNTVTSHSPSPSAPAVPAARDLTRQAPRSPRVRLGGYVILPRALDKGRAALAGQLGEYHFGCPLDQQFLTFVGVEADELRAQLAAGKSDSEVLAWVQTHARARRSADEIEDWCRQQEHRGPAEADSRAFFDSVKQQVASHRNDIHSWFDLLDVDDYVSFGGRS
jgi:hypothetical protein